MVTTPVHRKRCNLCLAILEISHLVDGAVCKLQFDGHTEDSCRKSTEARIRALEEMHIRDARELEGNARVIDDLGKISSLLAATADRGKKWIAAVEGPQSVTNSVVLARGRDLIATLKLVIAAFETRGRM